jgi:hypothetical protein
VGREDTPAFIRVRDHEGCYRSRHIVIVTAERSLASRTQAAAASAQVAPATLSPPNFGGGVAVKLFHRLSWRPAQVEYLLTRFRETTTNTNRRTLSASRPSVVFHF